MFSRVKGRPRKFVMCVNGRADHYRINVRILADRLRIRVGPRVGPISPDLGQTLRIPITDCSQFALLEVADIANEVWPPVSTPYYGNMWSLRCREPLRFRSPGCTPV